MPKDRPELVIGNVVHQRHEVDGGVRDCPGPATLLIGIAIDTVRPLFTSVAAAATLSGVR